MYDEISRYNKIIILLWRENYPAITRNDPVMPCTEKLLESNLLYDFERQYILVYMSVV